MSPDLAPPDKTTSRTALVVGGTSGIGRATVELLSGRGYRVVATGADPDSVARAGADAPDGVEVLRSDVGSLAATDDLLRVVGDRFGSLDVLFLNAGILHSEPVGAVGEASFDRQVDVNFKGPFFVLQKVLPLIATGGSVVITVGVAARRGSPGAAVGAATRGALLAMLPTLAIELAPRRIRVNAVSPGAVATPLWDKLGVPPAGREAARSRIPLGRFGADTEVAEVVAFLASDAASYLTGQDIAVAGGLGLAL